MTAGPKQLFSNLRRSPRIPVDLAGMAFFPEGAVTIRVVDLSYGGARIHLPLHSKAYEAQSIHALRIAGLLQLRVAWRWSRDRQAGVAFASPGLARGAIASLMDSGLTG